MSKLGRLAWVHHDVVMNLTVKAVASSAGESGFVLDSSIPPPVMTPGAEATVFVSPEGRRTWLGRDLGFVESR